MRTKEHVFSIVSLAVLFTSIECKKILFVPFLNGSHLFNQIAIGDKLTRLYHHEVHIVVPENQKLPNQLKPLYYHIKYNQSARDNFVSDVINGKIGFFKQIMHTFQMQKLFCDAILKDHKVINEMIHKNFDYLLIDSFTQCLTMLPKILKIPYSSCSPFVRPDYPSETGVPLSVQRTFLNPNFKNYSRFSARIKNLFIISAVRLINDYMNRNMRKEYTLFNNFYENKNKVPGNSRSDIWVITQSSYFLQPTPRSTAVVPVGGVLPVIAADKESNDLLEYINRTGKEVILVSFGSTINLIPFSVTNEMVNTFAKLPQFNFILKFNCTNLPSTTTNIKCVSWMPQTEILNSNSTKLFITHGGSNSMHESTLAGVPMIVMPLFGDQFYNAKLIEEKGLGRAITFEQIKNLKTIILDIVNNDSYKHNSVRASHIIRELEPDPAAKAAYYLNHVILYGAEHLKSNVDNLWLYQIYMYDIAVVFLMIISSCIISIGFIFWKCCVSKIRQQKLKKD